MDITFYCPGCAKKYKVPESMAGKKAPCKACGHKLKVPAESELAPPEFIKPPKRDSHPAASSTGGRGLSHADRGHKRDKSHAKSHAGHKSHKPEDRPRKRIVIPGEVDVGEYHLKEELEPWAHNSMKEGGPCPDCATPAKAKQVMCVHCGLNFKTGEKTAPAARQTPEEEAPTKKRFWFFRK